MTEDEVIRHNIKIRKDVHPILYDELSKTKNDRASIQRLFALATLGLLAERVGMRPLEFSPDSAVRMGQDQVMASGTTSMPLQNEHQSVPSSVASLDMLGSTGDLDELHDVFESAKSHH